jgi:cupin fold WbuC family metalloprotein
MLVIHDQLITEVIKEAKSSKRKRINYNFHKTYDARVQRMLNVMEPGTYVQPHKHENPDKVEAFIILKGKALVVEFNDNGDIITYCVISAGEGTYGAEIAPRVWHCILPLELDTVVYEAKDGPYSALTDKHFATWAPKEGEKECDQYYKALLQRCNIQL